MWPLHDIFVCVWWTWLLILDLNYERHSSQIFVTFFKNNRQQNSSDCICEVLLWDLCQLPEVYFLSINWFNICFYWSVCPFEKVPYWFALKQKSTCLQWHKFMNKFECNIYLCVGVTCTSKHTQICNYYKFISFTKALLHYLPMIR